jgi:hypothetical protein
MTTSTRCIVALAALALGASAQAQQAPSRPGVDIELATVEEGRAALTELDDFMAQVTAADISIRIRATAGSKSDLVRTYGESVVPWTDGERARLEAMLGRRAAQLQSISRWLPATVLLLKSNGGADTGLPHTRGAAINMGPQLPAGDEGLDSLFFHELFHVLSRHNAARHDEMYGMIGFVPCSIDLPADVRARTITNPDAPRLEHAAPMADGRLVVPVLFANPPRFDPAQTEFGRYIELKFLAAARDSGGRCALALDDGVPVEIPGADAVAAIHEVAGRNTDYVLHPEELLADNFAQYMTGRADAPDPEVQRRLAAFLGASR